MRTKIIHPSMLIIAHHCWNLALSSKAKWDVIVEYSAELRAVLQLKCPEAPKIGLVS